MRLYVASLMRLLKGTLSPLCLSPFRLSTRFPWWLSTRLRGACLLAVLPAVVDSWLAGGSWLAGMVDSWLSDGVDSWLSISVATGSGWAGLERSACAKFNGFVCAMAIFGREDVLDRQFNYLFRNWLGFVECREEHRGVSNLYDLSWDTA